MEGCYRQSESEELSQWVGEEKESDGHDSWCRVTKVEKDIEGATVIKSIIHQKNKEETEKRTCWSYKATNPQTTYVSS